MASMRFPIARLVAGVVLFIVLLAAYLVLHGAGTDTGALLVFGGPIVTYLLVGAKVDLGALEGISGRAKQNKQLDAQDAKLERITAQTNGELDRRIREAAQQAVIATLVAATPIPDKEPTS